MNERKPRDQMTSEELLLDIAQTLVQIRAILINIEGNTQ